MPDFFAVSSVNLQSLQTKLSALRVSSMNSDGTSRSVESAGASGCTLLAYQPPSCRSRSSALATRRRPDHRQRQSAPSMIRPVCSPPSDYGAPLIVTPTKHIFARQTTKALDPNTASIASVTINLDKTAQVAAQPHESAAQILMEIRIEHPCHGP